MNLKRYHNKFCYEKLFEGEGTMAQTGRHRILSVEVYNVMGVEEEEEEEEEGSNVDARGILEYN